MLYLLFDKALHDAYTFYMLTTHFPQHESLFKDTENENLWEVAPFLFEVDEDWKSKVASDTLIKFDRYLMIRSEKKLTDLRIHFQQFIYQKVEGRDYFFRIWDGAVLEKFLPTCTLEQLQMLYKPIDAIWQDDITENASLQFNIVNAKVELVKNIFDKNIKEITNSSEENMPTQNSATPEKGKARNWNI